MKYRIKKNRYDNWYGYAGTKRVIEFANMPEHTQQEAAEAWLNKKQIEQSIDRTAKTLGWIKVGSWT